MSLTVSVSERSPTESLATRTVPDGGRGGAGQTGDAAAHRDTEAARLRSAGVGGIGGMGLWYVRGDHDRVRRRGLGDGWTVLASRRAGEGGG